jgi:Aminoarabinose transferase C-terminal domain
VAAGLLVYSQHRNGMIPSAAVGWALAAAAAAVMAIGVAWARSQVARGNGALPPATASGAAGGVWQPLAITFLFIFIWQALLCEYTVIPPSRSAYQLVRTVAPEVHPGTALYSIGEYRQTIPPYLGRTLILVDFEGELHFGETREPGRQTATPAQFVRQWDASRDAIAFFDPRVWDHYRQQGLPGHVIAQDSFTVAVSRS